MTTKFKLTKEVLAQVKPFFELKEVEATNALKSYCFDNGLDKGALEVLVTAYKSVALRQKAAKIIENGIKLFIKENGTKAIMLGSGRFCAFFPWELKDEIAEAIKLFDGSNPDMIKHQKAKV